MEYILSDVSKTKIPEFSKSINFSYLNHSETLTFKMPEKNFFKYLQADWGMALCFSNFTKDKDLVTIFLTILLERSIVFFSKNIALLTATIVTFLTLIKPFEWPNPLIFNIPNEYMAIFESPVPFICGKLIKKRFFLFK